MRYALVILGLIAVFLLAYAVSSDRKGIRYRPIINMVILQFALAFALLNTGAGEFLVAGFANIFANVLRFAMDGVGFVFGDLAKSDSVSFFFAVLLPIVFVAVLIGILQYTNLLPPIIKYVGLMLSKVNGMGKLESYNAVASAIFGQGEVFISVKEQIGLMPKKRLYTLCASSMSTVSMSIVGSYMKMIEPRYVVTALVLNLFGGFIITSIINPYEVKKDEDLLQVQEVTKQSFFEMLGEYILVGFKIAVIVAAMLIGFVALIAMVNGIFSTIFGISFQKFLGYIFMPLAFLMGVPLNESFTVGSIMATKLVANEFVAMLDLLKHTELSSRSIGIISVFLISFANFSSIGNIAGAVKGLSEPQGDVVARFGLKLVYGASLVSLLSATVAGVFL